MVELDWTKVVYSNTILEKNFWNKTLSSIPVSNKEIKENIFKFSSICNLKLNENEYIRQNSSLPLIFKFALITLKTLPYHVLIDSKNPDVFFNVSTANYFEICENKKEKDWCLEHISPYDWACIKHPELKYIFAFSNKEDSVNFKLKFS